MQGAAEFMFFFYSLQVHLKKSEYREKVFFYLFQKVKILYILH